MNGPVRIFDRDLLDRRRHRALAKADRSAGFLLDTVTNDLIDRLSTVTRRFPVAIEIGSPTPAFSERMVANGRAGTVFRMDRMEAALPAIVGDEELLPVGPESVDLIVSALALHWTNDLPGALAQIRRALKPDGLFLAAFLGGDTLTELRGSLAQAESEIRGGAAPRVSPFTELRAAGALLQRAGFALPVIDQDRHTVRYDSAFALMHDLRAMGATNVLVERDRRPLQRRVLMRAAEVYKERFADSDGRLRATFDVISLSGWAPHESQQQPLKPGTARARLADALGATERSAGEKARH